MIALCSTTYAWFVSGSASNSNMLTSGSFDIMAEILPDDGELASGDVVDLGGGRFRLMASGSYTVTLTPTDSTNVKGHCVIAVNGKSVYKTNVIITEDTVNEIYREPNAPFVFTLQTSDDDITLSILPNWSVPAEYDVEYGGVVVVNTDPVLSY